MLGYLPLLAGKRLLIVAPGARLLAARCDKETFEATWAKMGKRWFAPAAGAAVEVPSGYITETDTHARFGDVDHEVDLLHDPPTHRSS